MRLCRQSSVLQEAAAVWQDLWQICGIMLWGCVSELEKINTGKVCRFACEAKLFLSYFHFDIQSGFDDNLLGIWPTLVQIKLTVSEKGILLQVLTTDRCSPFSLLVAFRPGWHIRMWCCKEFWCVSRVWKSCCEMGSYIIRERDDSAGWPVSAPLCEEEQRVPACFWPHYENWTPRGGLRARHPVVGS